MRRTSICALSATDYAGVSEGVHNLIYRDYFELRVARKNLRRAIWRSKSRLWRELQEILDFVPWGISYRIIMKAFFEFFIDCRGAFYKSYFGYSTSTFPALIERVSVNPSLKKFFEETIDRHGA